MSPDSYILFAQLLSSVPLVDVMQVVNSFGLVALCVFVGSVKSDIASIKDTLSKLENLHLKP